MATPLSSGDLSQSDGAESNGTTTATLYPGTGSFVKEQPAMAAANIDTHGDVTLNFVDADLRDVLRAVLGDALSLNYSVDPNVQGKITLQTSTPITRDAVLPTLEAALRLSGVALIARNGIYAAIPLNDAQHRAGAPQLAGSNAHGYGLQIVQLKYISVDDAQKILGAVAPQGGVVYTDEVRNLLILSGSEQDIDTLIDTISLFDVDYMKNVSFGIFTPANVTADVLAGELGQVMGTDNPAYKLVKLIPIARINALLVIAKQASILDDIKVWVSRLDVEGKDSTRRIFLYHVQNAKASALASTLGKLLGSDTGSANGTPTQQNGLGTPSAGFIGNGAASAPMGTNSFSGTSGLGNGMPGMQQMSPSGEANDNQVAFSKDGLRIVADEANNTLVILATRREFDTISSALKSIDIAPDQVLIEATIAEVSLTDQFKFGVQWLFQDSKNKATLSSNTAGAIASIFPGFSYSYLIPDTKVVLNALSSLTNVKVISSPKMMVLDNQTAALQVGDEVPVAVQSAVNVTTASAPIVNTIEFRQTGVILTVTPRINKSGLVIMDVSQEVSDVAATTTSGIDSPTIQQRKFTSTVAVQDGTTVALGGLIRDNAKKGHDGVPWLQDIPGIGAAFRETDNDIRRTELLVFMTPRIVRNTNEARAVTDYLREELRDANFVKNNGTR